MWCVAADKNVSMPTKSQDIKTEKPTTVKNKRKDKEGITNYSFSKTGNQGLFQLSKEYEPNTKDGTKGK